MGRNMEETLLQIGKAAGIIYRLTTWFIQNKYEMKVKRPGCQPRFTTLTTPPLPPRQPQRCYTLIKQASTTYNTITTAELTERQAITIRTVSIHSCQSLYPISVSYHKFKRYVYHNWTPSWQRQKHHQGRHQWTISIVTFECRHRQTDRWSNQLSYRSSETRR